MAFADSTDAAGVAVGATRFVGFDERASVAAAMAAALASGCDRSRVISTAAFSGFFGGGFIASSFACIDAMARKSAAWAVAVRAPGYMSRTSSRIASA